MTLHHRKNGADLRLRCLQIVHSIEQVFEPAVIALFERQEQVHGIEAMMERLSEAVSPTGQAQLNSAISEASGHLEAVAGQFGFLEKVANRLDRNARALRSLTLQQKQNMLMASMVATNAKVVSDSLEHRAQTLSGFASRVKRIISEAQEAATCVAKDLQRADMELARVAVGISTMTEAAHRLDREREAMPKLLDGLRALPDLRHAVTRSRAACRDLDVALQEALTQLQCGDAVRQRLEHVIAMLDHPSCRKADVRQVVGVLATAQMHAAIDTLTDALALARPNLQQVEKAGESTTRDVLALSTFKETVTFDGLAQLAGRMRSGLEDLDAQRRSITPSMERLSQAYADAAETTRAMADLETRMHLLGVNAMLVSSKIGTDGAAMTQVAKHLRDCTGAIGSGSAEIVRAAQLQELNAILFSAPTAPASDPDTQARLDAMQSDCEAVLVAVKQSVAALKTRGQRQVPTTSVLSHLTEFGKAAMRARGDIGGSGRQIGPLPDGVAAVLDDIRRTYTMEAERSLHDALIGAEPANTNEPAPEIEDFFF